MEPAALCSGLAQRLQQSLPLQRCKQLHWLGNDVFASVHRQPLRSRLVGALWFLWTFPRCTKSLHLRKIHGRRAIEIPIRLLQEEGLTIDSCERLAPNVARITSSGDHGSGPVNVVVKQGSGLALQGEAAGLDAIREASEIFKVPKVLCFKEDGRGGSYLMMEYLHRDPQMPWYLLGRALADLHLAEPKDPKALDGSFGSPVDGFLGRTPQANAWDSSWPRFWRQRCERLLRGAVQLRPAFRRVLQATNNLEALFEDEPVRPVLLHGDFWNGNFAGVNGEPAIYDPCAFYGHAEAEFGMSWCADLNEEFWRGYREMIPEAPLFKRRQLLYQAFHKMNHFCLFRDKRYLTGAEALLRRLL